MILKRAVNEIDGLKYIIEKLELKSAPAGQIIFDYPFLTEAKELNVEFEMIDKMLVIVDDPSMLRSVVALQSELLRIKDIRGTIMRLSRRDVMDEIELFEIKAFALGCANISRIIGTLGVDFLDMPNLEGVITLLDPAGNRIPHFYIYDSYSPELKRVRAILKELPEKDKSKEEPLDNRLQQENREELFRMSRLLEEEVMAELSEYLYPSADALNLAMESVVRLDILLAKALLTKELGLCRPIIGTHSTFKGLFNPQVKDVLQQKGKNYQGVDIDIIGGPTLIFGANMAGKTVLLKSVALAQTLCQYGFFVPADYAEIVPVDRIVLCSGDGQNELSGLSSFAAEMVEINRVVQEIKRGEELLLLIDEPARTTNPIEGEAIVSALLDMFSDYSVRSLVTSHYNVNSIPGRKLRIKGFVRDVKKEDITIDNINDYLDYSLVEDDKSNVPHEALRIASIMGVDMELLKKAERYLNE